MKLKIKRISSKLTQDELSKLSNVGKNKIARAELSDDAGDVLKHNDLKKIANVLKCNVEDLVGEI